MHSLWVTPFQVKGKTHACRGVNLILMIDVRLLIRIMINLSLVGTTITPYMQRLSAESKRGT